MTHVSILKENFEIINRRSCVETTVRNVTIILNINSDNQERVLHNVRYVLMIMQLAILLFPSVSLDLGFCAL